MKSVITKKQIVITAALMLLASAQASAKEILVAQVAAFTGAQASSGGRSGRRLEGLGGGVLRRA